MNLWKCLMLMDMGWVGVLVFMLNKFWFIILVVIWGFFLVCFLCLKQGWGQLCLLIIILVEYWLFVLCSMFMICIWVMKVWLKSMSVRWLGNLKSSFGVIVNGKVSICLKWLNVFGNLCCLKWFIQVYFIIFILGKLLLYWKMGNLLFVWGKFVLWLCFICMIIVFGWKWYWVLVWLFVLVWKMVKWLIFCLGGMCLSGWSKVVVNIYFVLCFEKVV